MAIICWGNLAKSADDTTRVEQSIHHYVQTHDENPNAHMGEDYSLGAHRLQTMLDHPYGSIYPFHVYAISADQVTTGALVVKGGGPYILVQDEAGAERVKIYPEGIHVTYGKILVKDEDGVTQIDGRGIYGTNVFIIGGKTTIAETRIPRKGGWYQVPGLDFGVYVSRGVPSLISPSVSVSGWGAPTGSFIRLWHDNQYFPTEGDFGHWWPYPPNSFNGQFTFQRVIGLHAGFNKFQVQVRHDGVVDIGNMFVSANDIESSISYMIMGS